MESKHPAAYVSSDLRTLPTQIGAGTFVVSRQYVGSLSVQELLQQRMWQTSSVPSTIDEQIGPTV